MRSTIFLNQKNNTMTLKSVLIAFCFFLLMSCTIKPKPIDYGKTHCHFCEMTIVDQNHAAFYVTKKGKQFNFDSVECMINELKSVDESSLAFIKVANFGHPSQFADATSSIFLVSPNIKSPMGQNLSAFSTQTEAKKMLSENGGHIFTWQEIKNKLNN